MGDINSAWNAAARNAALRLRAPQKASDTSGLKQGLEDQGHEKPHPSQPPHPAGLPQNEATGPVPLRHRQPEDSPRLTAAFVAQLLGQILPDPERRSAAALNYDRAVTPSALELDRRL